MELYAVAICESWIYVKCPYNLKQGIHLIENPDGNLVNRREKIFSPCKKCNKSFINITDKTERVVLRSNKSRTSFLKVKESVKRQECLHKIQINKSILNKNNGCIHPIKNYTTFL